MGFIKKFQCQHCQGIVETEFDDDYVICGHCDSACQVPKEFGPGSVIDDFVVAKLLGQGGMGDVYLAHQFSLDRKVALKILKDDFMKDPKFKDEFIYEARNVACLNHPNIIQAYKVGEEGGMVFFAMEYVEGRNLQDILREEGAISEKLAISVAMEIVEALGYAWKLRKLVHRDIKPENIMIASDGTAKLMDLGLSLRDGDNKDEGDMIAGTPQYISPEQILGTEMDIRGDFYCLGATLYHLVSGKMPFEGSLQQIVKSHLSEKPPSLRKVVPGIDDFFAKIIHKMMAKKPENRYEGADALLAAFRKDMKLIEDAEQGKKHFKVTTQTNIKTASGTSEFIERRKKKDPLVIASLVMLGILLGGFFLIRIFMSDASPTPKKQKIKVAKNTIDRKAVSKQKSSKDIDLSGNRGLFYSYSHFKLDKKRKVTQRSLINFDERESISTNAPDDRKNYYKLLYEGFITLPYTETYRFHLKADDWITFYIDDQKIGETGSEGKTFTKTFNKGTYPVKIHYSQHTHGNNMSLEVESISVNRTKIPKAWFSKFDANQNLQLDESKPGLDYVLYENLNAIPSMASTAPTKSGETSTVRPLIQKETGAYGASFSGLLKLPQKGTYKVFLNAHNSARLYINDTLILKDNNRNNKGSMREVTFPTEVNKIVLDYILIGSKAKLLLEIEGEGLPRQPIPAEWYFKNPSENFISKRKAVKPAPTKTPPKAPVKTTTSKSPKGLLNYKYYETDFNKKIEDLLKEKPVQEGTDPDLNITKGSRVENYGLYFHGFIEIPATNDYTFYLKSDDLSLLKIGGRKIVSDSSKSGATKANILLTKGKHKLEVFYYQRSGGRVLSLYLEANGIQKQRVPSSWYSIDNGNKPSVANTAVVKAESGLELRDLQSGLFYTRFKAKEELESLDQMLENSSPGKVLLCKDINMLKQAGGNEDNFGLVYEGYIYVESDQKYTFGLTSNDGSRLYLGDKLVINHDGNHPSSEKRGRLNLKKGIYKLRLEYYQGLKSKELKFQMLDSDGKMVDVPQKAFYRKK